MIYQEVKEKLEATKLDLVKKLENGNLTKEEIENIQASIDNYDYILELAEMNHFERGLIQ